MHSEPFTIKSNYLHQISICALVTTFELQFVFLCAIEIGWLSLFNRNGTVAFVIADKEHQPSFLCQINGLHQWSLKGIVQCN